MLEKLLESEKIASLAKALASHHSVLIENLWNAPKAAIAALALQETGKHILILTGASQEEVRLYHDFPFFTDRPVIDFPAWETLPSENIPPSPDIVGERYQALRHILSSKQPHIILTGLQACLQRLIPPDQFEKHQLVCKVGDTLSFEGLPKQLEEMGYQRKAIVTDKGEFTLRGGIMDVFPVSSPDPYRLEFWGDEITSIRTFDPIGQKSIRSIEQCELTPGQELELLEKSETLATILDYLGPDTIIILDDLLALEDRYASLVKLADGASSKAFSSIENFLDLIRPLQTIYWTSSPIEELSEVKIMDDSKQAGFYSEKTTFRHLQFQMFNRELEAFRWQSPFQRVDEYLAGDEEDLTGQEILIHLNRLNHTDAKLYFLCATENEEMNLQRQLLELKVSLPTHTKFQVGYLSTGFALKDLDFVVIPMTEITHRYKLRRQKLRSTFHTPALEVYDLQPGDIVVHLNHGIGRFLGLEKKPNHQGIQTEFFLIEYAENGKLYVPMNQAYMISKYIGSSEELPKMHTLGSNRWKRLKDQTQQAIVGYATELLEMYAQREITGGFQYPSDTPDMLAFEEDFPFEETEDQLAAVANIKSDMCSTKSMDRLICGDVGYGKTEVAMRAAFKAAVDGGKQVAVLVPTTVLAMQHYENFVERMANFPVEISVLSRFRTQKQIKETLKGAKEGTIDIIIGTHRIISQDVQFKNLGLIIIDEEQRFGVKAKEHLKKMKTGVDCITLSATPIPRTLYMSLVGARDMSIISTPPQDRLPIKTLITEANEQTFKNALLRELARDGQAFIIHNRVETIYEMADKIKILLPQARIVVGHGQMGADEIDLVFHAFKSGNADILVATSIIENGVDIPNANTILVDRADRFGLADLYQIRGRVGRWNRRAYAYFLVPSMRSLSEPSRKRLNALAEASGYGGGMKIALRDLEIRGAGNLLGEEQSGHVSSIGFHLYCKMLKRTIHTLQGKIPRMLSDVKIEVPVDARLPEEYVNDVSLRMEVYQRLGEIVSLDEMNEIEKELQDRFGPLPEPALWLCQLTKLRIFAALNQFALIKLEKMSLTYEKIKGKETKSAKVLFQMPKKPIEIETKLIPFLKGFDKR